MSYDNIYRFTANERVADMLYVHGSEFHADDVLCAAIMKYLNPDIEIKRVFGNPRIQELDEQYGDTLPAGICVADIGRGQLDHHQNDGVDVQGNGHKRSAIGLLLAHPDIQQAFLDRGIDLLDSKYDDFMAVVGYIEDLDNGVNIPTPEQAPSEKVAHQASLSNLVSYLVSYSNPSWNSNESFDERFNAAVDMVSNLFVEPYLEYGLCQEQQVQAMQDNVDALKSQFDAATLLAGNIVQPALDNMQDNIAVLDQYAPWESYLIDSAASFVIYPSNRGGFNLQAVPPELGSFDKKIELPADMTKNFEGCTFEHPGKFLASFDTSKQAIAAAQQIMSDMAHNLEQQLNEYCHPTLLVSGTVMNPNNFDDPELSIRVNLDDKGTPMATIYSINTPDIPELEVAGITGDTVQVLIRDGQFIQQHPTIWDTLKDVESTDPAVLANSGREQLFADLREFVKAYQNTPNKVTEQEITEMFGSRMSDDIVKTALAQYQEFCQAEDSRAEYDKYKDADIKII